MKIKVINNADDFGYSNAINYGIIDAHVQGILNSTTIMANMPGFEHANTTIQTVFDTRYWCAL